MMKQIITANTTDVSRRRERQRAYTQARAAVMSDPASANAWLELSRVVEDTARRRECLERALALDPGLSAARSELETLRTLAVAGRQRPAASRQLGEHLLTRGMISSEQLENALWEQRRRRQRGEFVPLGIVLVAQGSIGAGELARVLTSQSVERLASSNEAPQILGERLLARGLITALQLEAALEAQIRATVTGEYAPLGVILVQRGYLTAEDLQRVIDTSK
jgi:hypothetical protein